MYFLLSENNTIVLDTPFLHLDTIPRMHALNQTEAQRLHEQEGMVWHKFNLGYSKQEQHGR